ncbi:MAG: WYL domain-containing protein [Symploca sp. SIO1C4]|uniref:WYL domain-containing protein n=1 Tax=Symploca sp. SIO1C4 TaxID=2607765 RepID=A0A6B3NBJ3_9CYAN|nr:WYL domain-containing protein [Symploca sp. SIO1C4]
MSTPLICHFLIGPPGSGKSTLAAALAPLDNYRIISTDQIRETLYRNQTIQGNWSVIQQQVLSQIHQAIASHQAIIYDATNVKRVWRMELLRQLNTQTTLWMAWHLCTPLETCLAWNRKRSRQVPEEVIVTMFKSLQDFPPLPAEGFAAVNQLKLTPEGFDISQMQEKIKRLTRTLTNRTNRTLHPQITLHRYSRLLDFERLLHLIALIVCYPGIGNLHSTAPTLITKILGTVPEFTTPAEEVCALMKQLKGAIYADTKEIALDLQWLKENGLIGSDNQNAQLNLPIVEAPNLTTHPYSDIEPFERLLKTIRFILHHPFLPKSGNSSLKTLTEALQANHILSGNALDTLRKDFEKVLKPYKIIPDFPLRQGYFAGTGILSRQELRKLKALLQSQAKSLDDPVALSTYEMFQQRMKLSKLDESSLYPVRAIGNRCIVDANSLPPTALSHNLEKLENAIANGELLELGRIRGGGRFARDEEGFFQAWPLQIVFYNHAWYLALECEGGKQERGLADTVTSKDNLFRFERLDRLFLGRCLGKKRDLKVQLQSLQKLHQLQEASAGLFLGNSASQQQQFLSANKSQQSAVEFTVELWFNDNIFRFVSEGTKRYPLKQMKMSPPLAGGLNRSWSKSLFSLAPTGDQDFPHRFQVRLPQWALDDVDLWRWIVGFGGQVKVVHPQELVEKVKAIGAQICRIYQD